MRTACQPATCFAIPQACGRGTFWIRGEYLHWWTDGLEVPPLVTSSPAGTPQNEAGILGQPSTSVLFGDTGLNDDNRSGGQVTFGCCPAGCNVGIEVSYLVLEQESVSFQSTSQGDPVLARPFFNVETQRNDAYLVAFSELAEGSVSVAANTEFAQWMWCCAGHCMETVFPSWI